MKPNQQPTIQRGSYKEQSVKAETLRKRNIVLIGCLVLALIVCAIIVLVSSGNRHEIRSEILRQADLKATQYDYDGAIATLASYEGFESERALKKAAAEYENAKGALIEITPEEVTHIFFHSLINYPEITFAMDNQFAVDDYNQSYATVSEFKKILQSLYDRGFVLVSIHDLYDVVENEDGSTSLVATNLLLPEGKKPLILSLDDICYYEYMLDGDCFPHRVLIDEEGKPTCEMVMPDGSVQTGDFDTMPIVEHFLDEHPNFSYHGARGIIAVTGYEGILGYRTDPEYLSNEEFLEAHPEFDYEAECTEAKRVCDAMKACGWEFASHSWGHRYYGKISYSEMVTDAGKWKSYVEPLTGPTDVLIYAFGNDIVSEGSYEGNEKYDYLKSDGFNAFCNVNARTPHTVMLTDQYLRQGRRNIDGYRMYQDIINPGLDRLADLMDVTQVFDSTRPLPVPDF